MTILRRQKMSRKIKDKTGQERTIYAWFMLCNGWEYWQTKPADDENNAFGFVQGVVDEWGSFNIDECDKYIAHSCIDDELYDVKPPEGWTWVDTPAEINAALEVRDTEHFI